MKNHGSILTQFAAVTVSLGVTLGISSFAVGMGIQPPVATPVSTATPTPTPKPSPVAQPKPTATPVVTRTPSPTSTGVSASTFSPLWIGQNSDASNWTIYAEDALNSYGANLLSGPSDVETFCPMYSRLGHQDQINFWVQLLAGVTKYESGFNPVSYMIEPTLGDDPITGSQVISAGLFQLSYQDTPNYKSHVATGVCVFDYPADSKLAMTDIKRTINDPKTNITCAVSIMNYLVGKHGAIAYNSGNYWSTLMPSSKYGKVPQIKAITQALPFCKN